MPEISKNRIKIWRTPAEHQVIKSRIKELGKADLNTYIRGEVNKLVKKFKECPECITPAIGEKKKEKVVYIQDTTHDTLKKISALMGNKPISSIVDEFIITPLLSPNFAALQD